MRITFCQKCNKQTSHLHLVHNSGGYQYQYEACAKCDHRILLNKVKIPPYFEDAVRTRSRKPIEDFSKGKRKK